MEDNVGIDDFEEPYHLPPGAGRQQAHTTSSGHKSKKSKKHKHNNNEEDNDHTGVYGLDLLSRIGVVNIQQKMDPTEVNLHTEVNNRYDILTSQNNRLFTATEDTEKCVRNCCGRNRPFTINLYNAYGQSIVVLTRKCNCSLCCWGGKIDGSNVIMQLASNQETIGSVEQSCNPCTPTYYLLNGNGERLMYIKGPCCSTICNCCFKTCQRPFCIYELETNSKIGEIVKTFRFEERISDATSYTIQFEPDLDTALKTVIIGSVFCIDFSFFEQGAGCAGMPFCIVCIIIVVLAIIIGTIVGIVVSVS